MPAIMDPCAEISEEADHIKVSEEEGSEFMEFPKEEDNKVLLSTLKSQFPDAIGLKYRGASGAWRALKAVENVLEGPKGGWGGRVYCLTLSETKKQKPVGDASVEVKKGHLNPYLQDLAVLNVPFETTEEELQKYFEISHGDLEFCELKMSRDTGRSRGFGFIRFKEESAAKEALSVEHNIHGRQVDLQLTQDRPMKLFVGHCSDGTTKKQLTDYFSTFGKLSDVYIPTPFCNFAYVTYASKEDGKNVLNLSHSLDCTKLNVQLRNQDNRRGSNGVCDKDVRNQSRSTDSNGKYNTPKSQSGMDPLLKDILLHYLGRL